MGKENNRISNNKKGITKQKRISNKEYRIKDNGKKNNRILNNK